MPEPVRRAATRVGGRVLRHAVLAATVLLGLAACGGGGGESPGNAAEQETASAPEQKNVTARSTPTSVAMTLGCGGSFKLPPGGSLTVTGRFPAAVSAGEQVVSGEVEIRSEKEALRGTISPYPDVFLVQAGRIVATPQPKDAIGMGLDLAAGQVKALPARGTLAPCEPAGDAGGERRLAPGTYELYALVALHRDNGSTLEGVGGPWPLEVR